LDQCKNKSKIQKIIQKKQYIVIFLLNSLVFLGCTADKSALKVHQKPLDPRLERGKNVKIYYSEKGLLQVMIKAPLVNRAHDLKEPYTEMPSGVNVVFYDGIGMISSTLTAEYGKNEEKKELMFAKGNVKLSNIKNENLYAEELYWNQKTKKIYSEKFVKIITPDETIYGQGFESNEDFSNYSIKKIKGVISSDKLKKE